MWGRRVGGVRPVVAALVAVGSALLAPVASAATYPTVTLSTGLTPAFSKSVTDYTTTCPSGSVKVTLNRPTSVATRLDGKTLKSSRTVATLKLTPGQRFLIDAKVGSTTFVHSIRCLPADFPKFSVTGQTQASAPFIALSVPGLTSIGNAVVPYAFVIDSRGVPIWWKHIPGEMAMDVKALPNGNIGFWHGVINTDIDTHGGFSEYRLNGTLARDVPTVGGVDDAHESVPIGYGHYLRVADYGREHVDVSSLGGSSDQLVVDNLIEEFDSTNAHIWTWNTNGHIAIDEMGSWFGLLTGPAGVPMLDAFHINSIEEDGAGGLILSFRYMNAIYRIDKATGEVTWKLGGTTTDKSLTVLGDPSSGASHLMGQHDARVQADGTITVYDNGSGVGQRAPRATRWRIDPVARTATLVESLSDTVAPAAYAGGSARRFADGSWLVSWCHGPYVRAYDSAHKLLFSLKFAGSGRSYRAAPISSSQITRTQFLTGMDAQYPRKP